MYHIKPDKRSKDSSVRLYTALSILLETNEFGCITIKDLAETAAVARATFYRNFDSIEDILLYETDEKFKELKDYLNAYYSSTPNYVLNFFIFPFLSFWQKDTKLVELLISCNKISILQDAFIKLLSSSIEAYYAPNEIDIEYYNYFLALKSGIAINILVQWIKDGKVETPDEIMEILMRQLDGTMNFKMFARK